MSEIGGSPEGKGVFLDDVEEQLDFFEQGILKLEQKGESPEIIQKLFCAAHTLKGVSGMIGFEKMNLLTHEMENVLDKIRSNQLEIKKSSIDILFECLDCLRILKEEFKANDQDIKTEVGPLINKLNKLLEENSIKKENNENNETSIHSFILDDTQKEQIKHSLEEGFNLFICTVQLLASCEMKSARMLLIMNHLNEIGNVVTTLPNLLKLNDSNINKCFYLLLAKMEAHDLELKAWETLMEIENITVAPYSVQDIQEKIDTQKEKKVFSASSINEPDIKKQSSQTMRVDVDRVEKMMDLVGELVIEQTRISQIGNVLYSRYSSDDSVNDLIAISNHTTTIINELQEGIMKVRMIPIQQTFGRFIRVVRDLSEKLGKKVELITSGGEIELDRTFIEDLQDPLLHIIRNAIDHGIEAPEARIQKDKPPVGTLKFTAIQQEKHFILIIEDDGAGIDVQKLKEKAINKNIVTNEEAKLMSDKELINLIFHSGLSTSQIVSDVSGRGVGMDVVRNNIEKLNGIIDVESTKGFGTKFIIKLPLKLHLTLAILTGLLVKIGADTYALPMNNVVEIVRKSEVEIESVDGQTIAVIRKKVIPVVWLHDYFNIAKNKQRKNLFVVVLGLAEKRIGLVVDELVGNQEVVVKPLGSYIGKVEGFSGATILGDRSIACILDIAGIAKIVTDKKTTTRSDSKLMMLGN